MVLKSKTDLKFTSTDENATKITTTVAYVNPELSDNKAIELTQLLNSFTSNVYGATTRVTTEELGLDG